MALKKVVYISKDKPLAEELVRQVLKFSDFTIDVFLIHRSSDFMATVRMVPTEVRFLIIDFELAPFDSIRLARALKNRDGVLADKSDLIIWGAGMPHNVGDFFEVHASYYERDKFVSEHGACSSLIDFINMRL